MNMVNLTTIAQARKPHLIYGVKRGKVPNKLRPHLLPQSEKLGGKLISSVPIPRLTCVPSDFIDSVATLPNSQTLVEH